MKCKKKEFQQFLPSILSFETGSVFSWISFDFFSNWRSKFTLKGNILLRKNENFFWQVTKFSQVHSRGAVIKSFFKKRRISPTIVFWQSFPLKSIWFFFQPKTGKEDLKELQRSIQTLAATPDEGLCNSVHRNHYATRIYQYLF